tara:strand:+ start:412 stop:699 length:288 start_codon:yes stop_codon:yes gene_type:complete
MFEDTQTLVVVAIVVIGLFYFLNQPPVDVASTGSESASDNTNIPEETKVDAPEAQPKAQETSKEECNECNVDDDKVVQQHPEPVGSDAFTQFASY